MHKLFNQLGFTMIELLVVIAVIGVLAVAVLSSINPIEQINKGRDTRTRSDSAQLISAVDRFYATQELYPWNDPTYACGEGVTPCATDEDPGLAFPGSFPNIVCAAEGNGLRGKGMCKMDNSGGDWMDALSGTKEVKEGFISRIRGEGDKTGGYHIFVYKDAETTTNDTMYACFAPSSDAFKNEALLVCKNSGKGAGVYGSLPAVVKTAACPAVTGAGTSSYVANGDELICLP